MDDTQYFDIEDDGTFRCPHCECSYSFEIGIICFTCDERLCPECYKGNHLQDATHRENLQARDSRGTIAALNCTLDKWTVA